ncbi:MAG: riboflavin synthase [Desulfobacterales bacterium]|nr:MAG: riboflavin synthase [Desulfobacterales bacterium]
MFTGIIQGSGKLLRSMPSGGGLSLEIATDFALVDPEEGESIAVNGVCLTAYDIREDRFAADVSPESLSRTTLAHLRAGDRVNVERALRLSDRLGGHIVSGHVDCVGRLKASRKEGAFTILEFVVPEAQMRYLIEKGSVAIDGISLTVNNCSVGSFSVSIIPHTMKVTTLGCLSRGSRVNIEVDIIGKYVEKLLTLKDGSGAAAHVSKINPSFLAENGFW